MGEFLYEGIREGKRIRGKISGESRREVITKLRDQGVVPLSVEEVSERRPFWRRKFHLRKPSEEELAFILTQLSVLLESGISLAKSLEIVASQTESSRISSALLQIKGEIERGESLSSAFRRSGLFPEFLPQMLTAAETGENLERIFEIAGRYLETVADMKSRIINSVTYPSIVIGFSVIALFVAVKFVVPRIAKVLESFGKNLPLITKGIIFLSDLITLLLYLSPLLLVLFIYRERLIGRERLDKILLKLPGVGRILFAFDLSRFAYTLYMTLSASVPVTSSFRIAVGSMGNGYVRGKIVKLTEEIERGRSLSWVLRRSGIFPPLFINLVETGEASGELEKMLDLLAEVYRREALRSINLWVRMIEPVSILVIGAIVGIIVVSVLLPLTEITSGIGR